MSTASPDPLIIIAALTPHRIIGKRNQLPWYIKGDLQNFKRLTAGHTVIMGRNTFNSIGRPLPNRYNIVLNHTPEDIPGVTVVSSLDDAFATARAQPTQTFVIGGATVYAQTLPFATHLYLSFIKQEYAGDIYFPEYNEAEWTKESEQPFSEFTFVTFKRKSYEHPRPR